MAASKEMVMFFFCLRSSENQTLRHSANSEVQNDTWSARWLAPPGLFGKFSRLRIQRPKSLGFDQSSIFNNCFNDTFSGQISCEKSFRNSVEVGPWVGYLWIAGSAMRKPDTVQSLTLVYTSNLSHFKNKFIRILLSLPIFLEVNTINTPIPLLLARFHHSTYIYREVCFPQTTLESTHWCVTKIMPAALSLLQRCQQGYKPWTPESSTWSRVPGIKSNLHREPQLSLNGEIIFPICPDRFLILSKVSVFSS